MSELVDRQQVPETAAGFELQAPLSFQQVELVRRVRAAPACAPTLDLSYLFRVEGDYQLESLIGAIHDLGARHPALRTTLKLYGNETLQRVHASANLAEVRSASSFAALHDAISAARLQAAEIFDGASLFRAAIWQVGADTYLSFLVNHLIYDGWSYLVLWRDLSEFYAARIERRTPQLPPLRLTYADFAKEQRRVHSPLRDRAIAYWRNLLSDYSGRIVWPNGDPSPSGMAHSTLIHFKLDDDAAASVRKWSRAGLVTPFVVLLTASAIAVSQITGMAQILTGSNTANREDPWKTDLVGYFTNTRLAFLDTRNSLSLRDLLREVRDVWLTSERLCRDIYISELLTALGEPQLLKINMLDLPGLSGQRRVGAFTGVPDLKGARVTRIPVSRQIVHWREFELTWFALGAGYEAEIRHHSGINGKMVTAIADAILTVLAQAPNH